MIVASLIIEHTVNFALSGNSPSSVYLLTKSEQQLSHTCILKRSGTCFQGVSFWFHMYDAEEKESNKYINK